MSNQDLRIFDRVKIKDQVITCAMAEAAKGRDRPQENRDRAAELLGISPRSLARELTRRMSEDDE